MIAAVRRSTKKRFFSPFLWDRSGSVLILVVWSMALLGFFAVSSGTVGVFSVGLAGRFERDLQAYSVARAAVPYVLMHLENDDTAKYDGFSDEFLRDGSLFTQLRLGGGTLNIYHERPNRFSKQMERFEGIMDEERKLNLNTAETDTLTNLLMVAGGLDYPEARAFADRIEDWRDEDNRKRDGGAERFEYQALKEPYACKNAPFESVEELLLVYEMTPRLYRRIRPYVTVYGTGKVNLNTAEAVVLLSLGISETGVGGFLLYRSGPDGVDRTEDDASVASLQAIPSEIGAFVPLEDLHQILKLVRAGQIGVHSEAFSFFAEAQMETAASTYKIHAVVHRNGEILSWHEE